MLKASILLSLLFQFQIAFAQWKEFNLIIQPVINCENLQLERKYYLPELMDTVSINLLSFYISNIQFLDHDKVVHSIPNSHYLLQAENPKTDLSTNFRLPQIYFNTISFSLGIDSLTNVSGALGGDLDPTKGMYWTWQSGYINFKLEGTSIKSTSRNHSIQYHIGGYDGNNNALQQLRFSVQNQNKLELEMSINEILQNVHPETLSHIMAPGKVAVELSQKIASSIHPVK